MLRPANSADPRTGTCLYQPDAPRQSYLETLDIGHEEIDGIRVRGGWCGAGWRNRQRKRVARIGFQVERDLVQLAYEEQLKREDEQTAMYLENAKAAMRSAV